ncbi:MAG: hypothetical protein SGPRY_014236, partial [Prymnesium sp.]
MDVVYALKRQGRTLYGFGEKMARKACRLITTKLLTVQDVFEKLEPAEVVRCLKPVLGHSVSKVLTKVALTHAPDLWESLPLTARREIVDKIMETAPRYIEAIMFEMKDSITEMLDLEEVVVEKLLEDKTLINQLFAECGEAEFRFIERSGLYFGFLLGILQACVWYALRVTFHEDKGSLWWFLPAAGAFCGYVTNALALWLIFQPIEPKKYCGIFRMHGLFLQRQNEVSVKFAAISSQRVLTARFMWERIMFGPNRHYLESLVKKHIKRAIDEHVGIIRPFIPLLVGTHNFVAAKDLAGELMLAEFPRCLPATYEYTEKAMNAQEHLSTKMQGLSSLDFERVLHPVFEEDEFKLILVGGVLG